MAKSNFIVRGGLDVSGISQGLKSTEKQFKGFEGRINKTFGGIANGMGLNLGKLTKFALIGAALKGLYKFGKASIEVASDLAEVQNVVDVTFGNMSQDVNDFADNAIQQFGLSQLSAKKFSSTMGAMLKSSGISGAAAKDMSIDLAKLSADMASFYNLDNDAAFEKIMSGMSGMTQPLKELGINMNIANLEAYAMAQGISKSWQEMNQAEQTLIRYKYLLNVTGDAQGDFARNSGTWANQTKILKEQWKEFMGLIGTALIEVVLPLVKGLNFLLGILIDIAKEVGKIFTMITGREATVTSVVNNDIADSAGDAADGEDKLADGIGKAAKAAKKAIAPFDELNILQNNLNDGDSGGSLGGLNGLGGKGEVVTTMVTTQVDDGIDKSKERWIGFFGWINDKWNGLKQTFAVPITIPSPIFSMLPNPIYNPNWGLDLPRVKVPRFSPIPSPVYEPKWGLEVPKVGQPVFNPIPSPVYEPEWGLELPKIPVPIFPAIEYQAYNRSLEAIKLSHGAISTEIEIKSREASGRITEGLQTAWGNIETNYETHRGKLGITTTGISTAWETENKRISEKITQGLQTTWGTIETNYNKHKANVGVIALGISAVLVANTNQGLLKLGINTNNTITTTQSNWEAYGRNVGAIAAATGLALSGNLSGAFEVLNSNFNLFNSFSLSGLKSWGSGVLAITAEVGRGIVSNIVNSLSTAWENFKEFASATGEKVSGWFSANKQVITTTAITAGVIVGAGALALAVPAAIPYMASVLGGLSAIPALAKGGITNGEMIAKIGDNPGGREVVSPLDGLLDMIKVAVSSTSNNNNGDMTVIVKIGEDTITEKVVSNINRQSRISGKTIITV